jgi:hypothetical protein
MAEKKTPKVGEIRLGAKGNKYNKWNGKRWVPVSAARTAGASGRKPSVVSKPMKSASARSNAAAARYKAQAKATKKEPAKKPSSNQSPAARIRESIANLRIETKPNNKTKNEYLKRYGTTQGGKRVK